MIRRVALGAAASLVMGAALPAVAEAHGLVGRADLPVPVYIFAWAAAIVLVASFVGLATLWPTPRLQHPGGRRLFTVPRWVEPVCGALGIAIFAVVVYSGFAGTSLPTQNLAPTFVYVIFWVGTVFASLFFGNVFKAFSPWRALARAVAWMAGRVGASSPAPLKYPARLGRWPAAATIVAFAWLELVYVNKAVPSTLAWLATAYAVVQLVGMSLYGIEQWTERADGFGVYFGVIGRLAPLARRGRELLLRRPLEGATTLEVVPGTVALMCAVIGSTTFDGFSNGPIWNNLVPHLESFFSKLGLGFQAASEAGASLGLVVCISIVAVIYQLGVRGMRSVGGGLSAKTLAGAFAHSLAPIALAYIVAHYFSLLAYQGQSLAYLASDPLGHGSDLFGTAHDTINYGVINSTGIWYVQVGALILGHVGGLVLAHDRALTLYSDSRQATRSQGWMLTVMVGFTSLGLWLISSVNA